MAQAPTQDFIVKSGLTVQGTSTVTSSTGNTGTLQVDGGAAISRNLIIGEGAVIYGDLEVYGSIPTLTITTGTFTDLTVTGLSTLNAVTAGITTASQLTVNSRLAVGGLSELNNATLSNQTNSTSSTTGALQVSGGVGIQKDLWVGGKAYVDGYEVLTTATVIASTLQAVTEQGSSTTVAISVLNTTSSTSTDTGALTVVGGVGIGGDLYANALYINTASYINNSLIITTATVDLYATKTSILAGTDTAVNTATGIVTIWNTSTLQSVTDRGHTTTNQVAILNTLSSTSTIQDNALYVAGGVGIHGSFFVDGPAYFQNNVVFYGTSTSIFSTSTLYTDNYIDLHFPSGLSGPSGVWLVDDGKDIGHIYHHYKAATGDEHGALIWHNESDELRWYMGGVEYNTSTQVWDVSSATFGAFRAGTIVLQHTTSATSTTTGTLVVAGGVGIGGDLYANALYINTASYINNSLIITTATVDLYATKTSILAGTDTAVNTATGIVTIWNTSTLQSVTDRGATTTNAVSITNATSATSSLTGALTVAGGMGISKDLYVGGTIYGTFNGSVTGTAATATNLASGTAGQVPYQTAPGVTSFYGPGTAGQLLLSNGTSGPVYTNTASIHVGRASLADNANTATTSTNLLAGTAGQVPYQTAPNVTSFFGPGTAGNVLVSNGTGAPTYNNTLTLVGTTTSISTTTGALQVRGGVGVGGSVYVGNRVGFVGTNSASVVYQVYNAATNSLDTVFG